TPTNKLSFASYKISDQDASVKNTTNIPMRISDFRGNWAGWGVNISFSDLKLGNEDALSKKNGSIDIDCSHLIPGAKPNAGDYICDKNNSLEIKENGTSSYL